MRLISFRANPELFTSRCRAAPILSLMLVAGYASLVFATGHLEFANATLVRFGALPIGFVSVEPWRWLTSPFLHVGPLSLAFSLSAFVAWGCLLEKRIGAAFFLVVLLGSSIAGGAALLGNALALSVVLTRIAGEQRALCVPPIPAGTCQVWASLPHDPLVGLIGSGVVFVAGIWASRHDLARGWADRGLVATTLKAERRRSVGI